MTDSSPTKQEKKPGRPSTKELEDRVDRLEQCLSKIAHYSGSARIIREFGIEVWA
jgi:hypothetical protein